MSIVENYFGTDRDSTDTSARSDVIAPFTTGTSVADSYGLGLAAPTLVTDDSARGNDMTAYLAEADTGVRGAGSASVTSDIPTQWWRRPSEGNFEPITGFHKWEGRIVEIADGAFTAELVPLEIGGGRALYGDFELELLGSEEVDVGDLIYVTSRMVQVRPGVPPTKTLSVRLRRVGNWTPEQVEAVNQRAAEYWSEVRDLVG